MKKFSVDSDVVIWFLRGRDKEVKLIKQLAFQGDLFISVVTITEVRTGLRKDVGSVIAKLKEIFKPQPVDENVAEMAGKYKQKYNLEIADMLIAATAVCEKCILVTYNKRHFPMKDLDISDIS